jgi:phosphate transport system substrate-binding protein
LTKFPRFPDVLPRNAGLLLLLAGVVATACGGDGSSGESAGSADSAAGNVVTLTGAGATFPYPIYARWFSVYSRSNPVRVNYQSIGSGGGIRQMIEGTVDFGATDAPLTDEDLDRIPGTLSLPTVLGAVVVTYNLPELGQPVRLDGETISAIFLGEITRWQDPRIARLNPGVAMPDREIIPVHRSDGSGTTYVFTDYLTEISASWGLRVGRGNAVRWVTGLGARGNEGVTGQVRQVPGAIGYVEQVFARQQGLPMASILNRHGDFVAPSIEATSRAAEGVLERVVETGDFRQSIVDPETEGAYPISSWTYLLLEPHMADCRKAGALLDVIRWAITEGDAHARELHYAPLPDGVRPLVLERLDTVTCGRERVPAREVVPEDLERPDGDPDGDAGATSGGSPGADAGGDAATGRTEGSPERA